MTSFKELGLSKNTLSIVESLGFTEPSPIQEKVIPLFLKNEKDIVGQARTGSGKTAAFGLPLADLINESSGSIQALIMAPTRELAIQVSKQLEIYSQKHKLKVAVIYGGQNIQKEIVTFKQGVDILVATPGRMIDHIKRKTVKLQDVQYFILDEFDEMLKMGFIEDVDYILSICENRKRLLFFSATLPRPIQNIIKKYMPEYEHINIQDENNSVSTIQQFYYNIPESLKFELLYRLILTESDFYGLIFCKRRIDVDNLSQKLLEKGIQSEVIHGEIGQNQREKALEKFKKGYNKVLIATDVAARGIDIKDLGFVINYDLPEGAQEYTHRIGRTGRAGKSGVAISFIGKRDIRNFLEINQHVGGTIQLGKIPTKKDIMKASLNNLETQVGLFKKDGERPKVYEDMIDEVMTKFDPKDIIYYFMQASFKLLDPQDVHIENFEISKSSGFYGSSRSGGSRGYRGGSRSGGGDRGGYRGGSRGFSSDRGGSNSSSNRYGGINSRNYASSGDSRPPRKYGDKPYISSTVRPPRDGVRSFSRPNDKPGATSDRFQRRPEQSSTTERRPYGDRDIKRVAGDRGSSRGNRGGGDKPNSRFSNRSR